MMRRAIAAGPRVLRNPNQVSIARRGNAAWAKPAYVKIYESDFEKQKYPEEIQSGDHIIFAKLLYQLSVSESKGEKYVADITKGLAQSKMAIGAFWVDADIGTHKAFDNLEPGVRFTLRWMQSCKALETLDKVVDIFRQYVDSGRSVLTSTITLSGLPSSQATALADAKKASDAVFKAHFAHKKGFKLEYEVLVDPGIISGWRASVCGLLVEDMSAYQQAAAEAASGDDAIDYLAVPSVKVRATPWEQTIETDVLHAWCSELSQWDEQEQKNGV